MPSEDRSWTIYPDETGEVNPDALAETMMECAGILRRIGGVVGLTARRLQGEDGDYITESVVVWWKPHLPMAKRRRRDREEAEARDVEREHLTAEQVRHHEEAGELSDEELLEAPEPVGAE